MSRPPLLCEEGNVAHFHTNHNEQMTDWDERYRKGEHSDDKPHPLILDFTAKLDPGRALDVACGTGRHAIWLAECGWTVTAVDSSRVALEFLQERAREKSVAVRSVLADLEQHEFIVTPQSYELVVVCNYLQRDLFPSIRAGTCVGGIVIAIIAMVDHDPNIRPMNPAYLLNPGELRAQFEGWQVIHAFEGKPSGDSSRRSTAEIIARRPV
jgi:tellurite methyltransferase